jgi:hypothetical protein
MYMSQRESPEKTICTMLAPDYQLHWSRNVTIQLNQLTKLERSIREKRFWDRPYLVPARQLA